jgi:hypothetical protein
MPGLSDDQHAAFGILAACDALEEPDNAKAHEYLLKARKHAHAILSRYDKDSESGDSDEQKGQDQ